MTLTLEQIREAVLSLSKPDQARLLVSVASEVGDIHPGVGLHPEVCGGSPRINRTRIPVWTLEALRRQGLSEAEILQSYPGLNAEDLVNAWTYVRSNKEKIDAAISENEAE